MKEAAFKTEAALCAAFIEWAKPQGVTCYAEWWGWDILVVYPDGAQLGIQAKLRLNAEVIAQASPSTYDFECNGQGPDFRAVLVPDYGRSPLYALTRLLGLVVFSGGGRDFGPPLRDREHTLVSRFSDWRWTDWNPPQRHDLPPTATDAVAGSPCPVQLTPWKIAALDVLAELQLRGPITTKRMKELHVDPRRWLSLSWLVPAEARGAWVRGPRCPAFDEQHPTAYAAALEKGEGGGVTHTLSLLDRAGVAAAQQLVTANHYLRKPVDPRCSVEAYGVSLGAHTVGVFVLGRPQATACYPWYGSVADVASGRAAVTRWQVLNLARVYFYPCVQPGGACHLSESVPGFRDRRGVFRSTLGSTSIEALAERVVLGYLVARPPCFLDEPYELRWLLSYCDTRIHRGALYRAAGFDLFRTNAAGVQTWRLPLRPLSADEDLRVREAAASNSRSIEYRRRRAEACA